LGIDPTTHRQQYLATLGLHPKGVMAVYTGEKRTPRKGEWYLSGSIVEAYRAPNDLGTVFHIARLVKVEEVTIVRIIP